MRVELTFEIKIGRETEYRYAEGKRVVVCYMWGEDVMMASLWPVMNLTTVAILFKGDSIRKI